MGFMKVISAPTGCTARVGEGARSPDEYEVRSCADYSFGFKKGISSPTERAVRAADGERSSVEFAVRS